MLAVTCCKLQPVALPGHMDDEGTPGSSCADPAMAGRLEGALLRLDKALQLMPSAAAFGVSAPPAGAAEWLPSAGVDGDRTFVHVMPKDACFASSIGGT
jgi:hypothetical protein